MWDGHSHQEWVSDEILNGFHTCEETPKVEQTDICSDTNADAICRVLFCLTEHGAEENEDQGGGQDAFLLDAIGDGEAAWQWPIVLRLALLTCIEVAEDG